MKLMTAVLALTVVACTKPDAPSADTSPAAQAAATGTVITVTATTDAQGNNVFQPAEVHAKPGDVVRFTLGQGVHNVHFLADSNPGVQRLPAASEMLQLPGQTYDVTVTFAPGTYYFQCDPHALLGMKGHLVVGSR